jgi:hypothetical protein
MGVSFSGPLGMARGIQNELKTRLRGFAPRVLPTAPHPKPTQMSQSEAEASASSATAASGPMAPTKPGSFLTPDEESMLQMINSSVELSEQDWLQQKDALDDMFDEQARAQLENLPNYQMPALHLKSRLKLFEHQVQGIRWLIHQEKQDLPSYFERQVRNGRTSWMCKITRTRYKTKPHGMKGGILADDMGLVRLFALSAPSRFVFFAL